MTRTGSFDAIRELEFEGDSYKIVDLTALEDERLCDLEYEGPTPAYLETSVCTECGTNVWRTHRGPCVAEYDTGAVCGYCSYECYFTHRHPNNLKEIVGEQSVYFPPA